MTRYSDSYDPSAAIAYITLRNPDSFESIDNVSTLLDTGSDITLLPRSFCEQIGVAVSETEFLELEGFDLSTSLAYYVRLDLTFLDKIFRGNFLVYDQAEGIIGRDILNKFSILFDGPNLHWEEVK
jgi:hypothetical protein